MSTASDTRVSGSRFSLAGSRFVITGGGTGIGLAVARLAAERGASVVLLGRTSATLESAAALIGPAASFRVVDVTDGPGLSRAFQQIGSFDHLVTCAAGITIGAFRELAEEDFRNFFEVKFWGQYRALRAALGHISRAGSVTLLSGFLYRKPSPGFSAFAAVNGAIEALIKVLAIELAPLRINALAPGQVDTLERILGAEGNRARKEAAARKLPLQRIGTPEEIAHMALCLAENTFMTGAIVDVDGGE
jgi:NAD(P)-dependent dehydrogenase (short-subunit alcohol dehydrogenase family)